MNENVKNKKPNNRNMVTVGKYQMDIKRVSIVIGGILIVIAILLLFVFGGKKEIAADIDRSSLDAKKYTKELITEYSKDGMKEKFLTDYEYVQSNVGLYILNNSTMDQDSFATIMKTVNEVLPKEDWSMLGMNRPEEWNGNWSADDKGNIKFTFAQKGIEPSWAADSDISSKVVLH